MFVICWQSERFGLVIAGSVHDWERDVNANGVLKFDCKSDAETYLSLNIWERPAFVVELV